MIAVNVVCIETLFDEFLQFCARREGTSSTVIDRWNFMIDIEDCKCFPAFKRGFGNSPNELKRCFWNICIFETLSNDVGTIPGVYEVV